MVLIFAAISRDISEYGNFDWFVSKDAVPYKFNLPDFMNIPETEEDEIPFEDGYIVKKGD